MNEPERLYLCDKKPGACRGWDKGWTRCMNEMCDHTTNANHARVKNGHLFVLVDRCYCKPFYREVEHD